MAGRYQVEFEQTFQAARPLVWAIVADTNRWDRAAGLAVPTYEWLKEGGKNLRLARATELGIALEWIEPPYRWIEGRHVEGERRFRTGPVEGGGFQVTLEDVPGGTRAKAVAWVTTNWAVGFIQKMKFKSGLKAYFEGIEDLIGQSSKLGALAANKTEPAITQAQRILLRSYSKLASGPRSLVDEVAMETRLKQLSSRANPDVMKRLVDHVRTRADDDIGTMKPFELAKLWGLPKQDVLRTFLYATEAGVTDLSWQINCPTCRVGASVAPSLGDLKDKQHCGACEIDYSVDFARHVEAVFPVNRAIRVVEPKLYCASSPAFLPHVFAQLRTAARSQSEHDIDVPLGEVLVRTLWSKLAQELMLSESPARIEIHVGESIDVRVEGTAEEGKPTRVVLVNNTDDEVAVLMERTSWSSDAVLGTVITSMPEFSTLFATEAPASGVELRVGQIALLFSDLTGSTALYERVGDAKAFAIVEQHFRLMEEVVGRHGGGVVKTMGDAVMASFPSLGLAVEAGLEMVDVHDAAMGDLNLTVKIGAHVGPCLCVRANDRLDYFGTTVNVAARLQAQAGPSEVVITEAAMQDPAVARVIGFTSRTLFEARLKGIKEEQRLVSLKRTRS